MLKEENQNKPLCLFFNHDTGFLYLSPSTKFCFKKLFLVPVKNKPNNFLLCLFVCCRNGQSPNGALVSISRPLTRSQKGRKGGLNPPTPRPGHGVPAHPPIQKSPTFGMELFTFIYSIAFQLLSLSVLPKNAHRSHSLS